MTRPSSIALGAFLAASAEPVDYHSLPGRSSSQIGAYLTNPLEWWHVHEAKDWPAEPPTPAMMLGTLVHKMIELGGPDRLALKPAGMSFATTAGKLWRQEHAGQAIVDGDEAETLRRIWGHFSANPDVMGLLDGAELEVIHCWDDWEFGPCRVKPDAVKPDSLTDWKTTSAKTEREFVNEICRRFYDVRISFYRRGWESRTGLRPPLYIVGLQTVGGHEVWPIRLNDDWADDAEARMLIALDGMKRFDLAKRLARPIRTCEQPGWAKLNLATLED